MKTKDISSTLKAASLFLLAGIAAAQAQSTYVRQAGTAALNSASAWSPSGPPGSSAIGEWNSVATSTGDTITSVGGAYSIGELQFSNNLAGAVSITDATAADILSLWGAANTGVGLDLSVANANLTLGVPLAIATNQTWNISSARTVNYTGVNWLLLSNSVLTITGGGTFLYEPTTPPTTAPASSSGAGLVIVGSTVSAQIQETSSSGVVNYLGANTTLTMSPSTTAFSKYSLGEVANSGNHSQTFTSLTLNSGSSIFTATGRTSSSGNSVGFSAVARNGGSMADFAAAAFSSGKNFGSSANCYALPGSTVAGYATVGANDWVQPKGAASYLVAALYEADAYTTTTNNVNVTGNDSPAAFTVNSLRFTNAAASSMTLTLTGANTISSGGILVGSSLGANTTTITGGSLTSGNANSDGTSDLVLINNTASSGNIIINSTLTDNGSTSVGFTTGTTSGTLPTGSVELNAANTFSGATTITSGNLLLGNSLALQNSVLNYNFQGTLSFGSLTAATFGGLSGAASLALPSGFALTLGNNNHSSTYSGAMSGSASLTKIGTGTLTLNGANVYTGNTTVSAGTLALGASGVFGGVATLAASATLDVSSAGNYSLASTVAGAGSIKGALTLASGGELSPTGTTGMLTLSSNLTLSGGTIAISVNASTPTNGVINIGSGGSGNLTLSSGTVQLSITGTLANGTYKIIGVPNGTITGSGSALAVSGFDQAGQAAALVANANELDLVVSTYIAQNLVWLGDGSANLWNVKGAANWDDTGPTVADPSVFHNGDYTVLNDSSANQTVNLSGTLSPASVTINGTKSYTLTSSGSLGGSASLVDNSSGTLTVLTTNSYTGGTTIASGAAIQVGNGTTAGGELGSGPVVDNSSLVYDLPSGSQTMGAISGTGTLTNLGAGTLVLNAADTLAGATTITAGTVKQGAAGVLPNGSGVGDTTVNGTLDLNAQSGGVNGLFGTGIINNSGGASATLTVYGSSAVNPSVFGGVIENTGGALALNFDGVYGNELQLTNNNTYTGGTIVTAGTLQLGDTNAISSGSLNVAAAGTVDVNGFSPTVDALTGAGTVDDVSAGGTITLTIGNNGGSGTFSGIIQNSSGTVDLVKNGTGTETLSGANSYSGTTTVNAGTLVLTTGGVINGTTLGGEGFLVTGGTLSSSGTSVFGSYNNAFIENSGTVNVGTFEGNANDGTLIEVTGGSFTASAVTLQRTYDEATAPTAAAPQAGQTGSGFYVDGASAVVNLGTLSIGTENSSASAREDAGNVTVTGEILVGHQGSEGRWSVLQVSGGMFTSSDTANGVVIAANDGASYNDAEVYLNGGTNFISLINFGLASDTAAGGVGWLFVNGGNLYIGSGGIVKPTTVGYTANIELTSGLLGATANWSSSLPMNLNGTNFTIQTADNNGNPYDIALSGILSVTTNSSLTVQGGGILTLSAANQYNGGTVVNGGTLNINGLYALGGANYDGLTLTNGATLQYAAAFSGNGSGDLTLVSTNGLTLAAGSETIDVNGNAVTYSGSIGNNGSGSLTLASTIAGGVLSLQSTNTYTGNTIINGGTLNVNGSIISPTVTVNSGGGLGGAGFVSGSVSILASGVLAPGNNSLGTNILGSLTLNSGCTNNFGFSGAANCQTVVSNANGFVINDSSDNVVFNLYVAGSTSPWSTAGTYNLIQYSGTAPSLDSTWTTSSATNPHIANPQINCLYSFATSGGYLTLTISLSASAVAGIWTNNVDGNWTAAVNWSSNPKVPHAAGDTATFGNSTAFRNVDLNANESVGSVTFNNSYSFNIANGGDALTLDNTGAGASIYVLAGSANSIQTAVGLNDNAAIAVTSSNAALTISGVISNSVSGTKTLAATGSGTLTLAGNNTYGPAAASGYGTTVNGPTLQVANNNALAAGDVSIAGNSTLQAGAAGLNVPNNFDVPSGVTVTVNNNGKTFTLAGNISDGGSLTEVGAGTLVLAGNNSYSGNTTVDAGVLSLSASGNLPNTAAIDLNGGDLLGTGTFTVSAPVNIGPASGSVAGTALVDAASGQSFTLSGIMASAGNTSTNNLVVNSGVGNTGTVIISGANTFSGTTVVSNGMLDVAGATSLQDSTVDYANQGGLMVFDSGISAATLGALIGSQTLGVTNLGGSALTLSVGNNNASSTFAGNLVDAGIGGALTKVGSGVLTLSGNVNLAGATTVSDGELLISNSTTYYTSAATIAAVGGAELALNAGTLVVTNASTVGNPSAGLQISGGSATFLSSITEASAANGTFIGVTGGSLTAASLSLGRTGLNNSTQPTAGSTGDGLYITNGSVTITGNINMGSATAANSSVNVRVDSGSLWVGGAIYIGLNNGGRWSDVDINGGTLTVTDVVTGISIGNALAGDAVLLLRAGTINAGIIGLGYGTVSDTAVLDQTGGSLYLGSGGIVQVSPDVTPAITLGGGLLGASTNWICTNAIQLTGRETVQAADANNNAQSIALEGALSGTGSLVKTGAGVLSLSGVNTYTGATTISNGVLAIVNNPLTLVDGAIATTTNIFISAGAVLDVSGVNSGVLALATGQALGGNGTLRGTLDSTSGGTVSPGGGVAASDIGVLTVTNLIKLGGTTSLNLNRTNSPNSDELVALTKSIAAGGTLTINNVGPALVGGDSFQLFSTNYTGHFTLTNLPTLSAGMIWSNTLALNGRLSVLQTVATYPTNITYKVSGNTLSLAWPADHTGWTLQEQTNSLSVGLSTNWVNVSGSTATNAVSITIDPTKPAMFFRLNY